MFFDPARGADMPERRKRGGHLISKHRFVAAQIEAYLADDLLAQARAPRQCHGRPARGRARRRGPRPDLAGRGQRGFVAFRRGSTRASRRRARATTRGRRTRLPSGSALPHDATLVRLVTSFATTADEVDRFVATAGASLMTRRRPSCARFPAIVNQGRSDSAGKLRRSRKLDELPRRPRRKSSRCSDNRIRESCLETEDRTLR